MKPALLAAALAATLPPLVAATPASAASTDLAALDFAVAQFTGIPVGQPGGAAQPVDRRMRLAACVNPPSTSWYGGRRDTVLLQCPDLGGWRLFVPILQAAPGAAAVLRGEAVTIAVQGQGFAVSQPGEAMDAGAVGAWIRVRAAGAANGAAAGSSGQPLRAQVIRPGLVRVDLDTGSDFGSSGNDLP